MTGKSLLLVDKNDELTAYLPYNNIFRTRELNGMDTLELETSKEVKKGARLVFQDKLGYRREYIIYDYEEIHDEEGISYKVYCENSISELFGEYVDELKPRNISCTAITKKILDETRFELGRCDDFGTRSFNLYHTSVKEALAKIIERYGAEYRTRIIVQGREITHRYIDLVFKVGEDNGKRFSYKKDLGSVKRTIDKKELATALYVYGKGEEIVGEDGTPTGGYGRKINFADINRGKKYLEDDRARRLYGVGKERRHIWGIQEFPDCEDKAELLELGKKALKERSEPKISYDLKAEDISGYEGYSSEGVDLGDTVLVVDDDIQVKVKTRVIKIKDNPLEEKQDADIELGNFVLDLADNNLAYEKLKASLDSQRSSFEDELERLSNGVKSSYIDSVVDAFNEELNSTGGYVYAEPGEGLLILNAPKEGHPTMAINLKGGIMAIANSKKGDGSWNRRTFGDGDGFTADLIRVGILKGGKVFWNLEDGTFIIGNSASDYSLFWDGSTLHLRNVDLDLENNDTVKGIKNSIKATNGRFEWAIAEAKAGLQDEIDETNQDLEEEKKAVQTRYTDLQSQIKQTASGITSTVSATETKLQKQITSNKNSISTTNSNLAKTNSDLATTKADLKSEIKQTASGITSTVSSTETRLQKQIDSNKSSISTTNTNLANAKVDLQSQIKQTANGISSTVSATETRLQNQITNNKNSISTTNGNLSSAKNYLQSQITQNANGISTKVSKNGVISSINQSSESVKIKASRIDLTGNLNLTGRFRTYFSDYEGGTAIDMHGSNIDFHSFIDRSLTVGKIGNHRLGNQEVETDTNVLTVGHFQTSIMRLSFFDNSSGLWKPYISFDRWNYEGGHYTYNIDVRRPIIINDVMKVNQSLQVTSSATFNGKIYFNNVKITQYTNAFEIMTYDGKNGITIWDDHVSITSNGVSKYF